MGKIKGQIEYEKFKTGNFLTRKEAMLSLCYDCNGQEESREDCQGKSCPMYQYMPYKGVKTHEVAENRELVAQTEKVQP